jgi:glutamate:GABA antiporter
VLGTLSVLIAIVPQAVDPASGVMQAIGSAASRLQWTALTPVAALLVTLSCIGSCSAWLGAVARLPLVAGIDNYLPAAYGRVHPRWGSPIAALLVTAGIAAALIFMGQSGTSVGGAYQVLVSSTVVTTLIPFGLLFAAALKLHGSPRASDMVRIPGGKWTVSVAALVGLVTTLTAIVFAGFPADNEPNKTLAVAKVVGLTALVVLGGVAIYIAGRRKALASAPANNEPTL